MSLSLMSPVDFKKGPCRCVEFRGRRPLYCSVYLSIGRPKQILFELSLSGLKSTSFKITYNLKPTRIIRGQALHPTILKAQGRKYLMRHDRLRIWLSQKSKGDSEMSTDNPEARGVR